MRRSRTDLRARVNGDLAFEFAPIQLTSYAGLALFGRYLRRIGFNALVREACGEVPGRDYGVVSLVRVLIALLVVGGRRLRHLGFLADDRVVRRFAQLRRVPSARTVSRWLQGFTMRRVAVLQHLNAAILTRVLATLGGRTWTVDVDGIVVSTGLTVERAFRGFNPHHRKVPSYYPIVAHLAETSHIVRVQNRSGNVHDGKAGLPFLRDLWTQLTGMLPRGARVRFRMDGAFFRQDVLVWLAARRADYAVKVPFYQWLDLQQYIRAATTWVPIAPGLSALLVPAATTPWGRSIRVAIYRKHVAHRAPKNYQLDLFDPNDGHYEYSAVTTNLSWSLAQLWAFACGRGNQEKTFAQLKSGLAFHTVPTLSYAANSAWQQLVALTHNLITNFQIETDARRRRAATRKRTTRFRLQTVQTLRFTLFNRAALLIHPRGRARLRLAENRQTREGYERIARALARAA